MAKSSEPNIRGSIAAAVITRIFLGGMLLASGLQKLANPAESAEMLKASHLMHSYSGPGGPFPDFNSHHANLLASHLTIVAWALIVASIVLGTLLLIGLFTRAAAFLTLLYSLFLWQLWGLLFVRGIGPNALTGVVLALAILFAAAGRTWGVDAALMRKARVPWLW